MKLTDTQTAVLEAAANAGGRITQFPPNVRGGAQAKVIQGLVGRGLVAPEGDGHVLTDAGYAAIGQAPGKGKKATILALLRRPEGATLPQLVEATGLQPHSVRGALSRMGIRAEAVDGVRVYRVSATA